MPGNSSCGWHDDTLRALVARAGGRDRQLDRRRVLRRLRLGGQGIDCARAIQRTLAEHRRSSGFALSVRVGLHTAEASRRGKDYSGVGVHLAARVAAAAGGGEILATAATLAEAGDVETSNPREASLKGVTGPVSVASVAWT